MITCRVCLTKSPPQSDAVLLCASCRLQADALTGDILDAYDTAHTHVWALFTALPVTDMRRAQAVHAAYDLAERNDTVAIWERRVQATIAQGGTFAVYLEARLSYLRTATWYTAARAELAALADEAVLR